MMLHRHETSVEEGRVEGGRVDDGNKRGRNGARHDLSHLGKKVSVSASACIPDNRTLQHPCAGCH